MRKSLSIVATAGAVLLAGNIAMMPVATAGDALPTDKQCKKSKPTDAATKGWCVAEVHHAAEQCCRSFIHIFQSSSDAPDSSVACLSNPI